MSSPVNVGDILAGKYQVERVLGMGGMGVVVSAKHLTLGERVAIKFLLPQALARNDVVRRFLQEGQAAARLRSEHVARVHDVGKLESGAPFLVMEYLDGNDLGAVLRDRGPMPVEEAVDFVLQACEALAEAHSAGIIHRDLKPSNLFLIKRLDGSPSIKLIDFGISKIQLPGAEGAEGEMTATAVMMGSPLYMAPEQMASARDVDGRSDIWSLGIILHTMLTGSPPFRAPSVMQVYELIVQGAPPIRKARADVPAGIETAILKCLQKDRRQRYNNVGELADAIAEFGPPQARFAADRIKRIIVARSPTDSMPPPVSEAQVPVVAVTPAAVANTLPADAKGPGAPSVKADGAKSADGTSAELGVSGVSQPSSAAIELPGTDGPWDQRTHPPSRRPRPAALIAAAVALLIGAPVAFFVLRDSHGPPAPAPAAGSASVHPVTVVPAPSAPEPPTVLPGASIAPPLPTSEPSVPPRDTAEPVTNVHVHPRPPPPQQRPPPRPRADDHLFDTQK
jgi:eukaryotic-like serine/threonine-protein kinase